MDFVDDQHPNFKLPRKGPDSMPQSGNARAVGKHAAHSHEKLFVEVPLDGRRGHLNGDNGNACSAELLIEMSTIVAQKFLYHAGLAHTRAAVNNETWHAVPWRIVHEIRQTFENTFGAGVLNPALLANPRDAFFIAQLSDFLL